MATRSFIWQITQTYTVLLTIQPFCKVSDISGTSNPMVVLTHDQLVVEKLKIVSCKSQIVESTRGVII